MFDGLLGSKFSNNCKHATKRIKSRLDPIRKKKQAMLKFLKKDVADLLANGHDINAFGRIEGLIVEINQASCYEMIEQFCECILKHLPSLQKQRECPEEVTEVASTLIFAAARYPDLPELCDLRQIFTAKYGTNMESYANREFVERVQQKSFSKEKKLQVIQDIAREFSVEFDLKAFERKLSNPPEPEVERPKRHISLPTGDEEVVSQPTPVALVHKQQEHVEPRDIHVMCDVSSGDSYDHVEKTRKVKDTDLDDVVLSNRKLRYDYKEIQKDDQLKGDSAYRRRKPTVQEGLVQEYAAMKYMEGKISKMVPPDTKNGGTKNGNFMEKNSDGLACEKAEFIHCGLEKKQGAGSLNGKSIGEVPLYAKQKASNDGNNADKETCDDLSYDRTSPAESEHSIHERRPVKPANKGRGVSLVPPYVKPIINNLSAHNDRSDCVKHKDSINDDERTTPMSVRRNFARPRVVQINEAVDEEKIVSRAPTGRRRLKSRGDGVDNDEKHMDRYCQPVGREIDNAIDNGRLLRQMPCGQRKHRSQRCDANYDGDGYGDKVVDERTKAPDGEIDNAIDYGKLLHRAPSGRRRHSSRRTTSDEDYDEEEGMMDKLLYRYSKKGSVNNELSKTRTRTNTLPAYPAVIDRCRVDDKADSRMRDSATHAPERAVSLPAEVVSSAEATRVPVRSTSMQPDLFSPNNGHVHPRMPDYDELAARISALRMT